MQTLLVTLFRRLRIGVLLLAGGRARCWFYFGLSEPVFRLGITIYDINAAHERRQPCGRSRGARYSSLQVLDEGWTAKQVRAERAVQGGVYLSRDHSHASLVRTAFSISCGAGALAV